MEQEQKQCRLRDRLKDGYTVVIRWTDILWVTVIGLFSGVCLELFYRMIVDYNDKYSSDMRYYVVTNVTSGEEHDRLLGFLFQIFYDISQSTMEANIYLAAVIAAIIVVNYLVIRFFLRDDGMLEGIPRSAMQFFSVAVLFIGPIWVPVIHGWFYRHSFQSFAWHSPTQQSMTLFSMIASLCFLKMYLYYEEKGAHPGWWIATAVTVFLSAFAKPSFLFGLVAAVVVMFVIDLLRGGKDGWLRRIGRLFVMGCAIVPSGIYVLWLHTQEFDDSGAAEEVHKVILDISHVIHYDNLPAAVICGMAFPLVVCFANIRRLKDRKYQFTFWIFFMGVLQWALLTETGRRGKYGNFGWGQVYGSYFITLVSCALALENFYHKDSIFAGKKTARTIYFIVLAILLVLHIASQLYYFQLILTGHGYMH